METRPEVRADGHVHCPAIEFSVCCDSRRPNPYVPSSEFDIRALTVLTRHGVAERNTCVWRRPR